MSWKVYKWDGRYIQGELVSSHSSESAALKAAKKSVKHTRTEKSTRGKPGEIVIWLDAKDGTPLGLITKKTSKRKKDNE
jgi:hypothetical protein